MNETSNGLAVFRTQLPYVDRRALSEAWFSALRLAGPDADVRPRAGRVPAQVGPSAARTACGAVRDAALPGASGAAARRYAAATARPAEPAADSARRFEVARPAAAPLPAAGRIRRYVERQTSLTLGVGGSRVQLVLRREGALLHVVALCRAEIAPDVRAALARADGHLRLAGGSLRASVTVRP